MVSNPCFAVMLRRRSPLTTIRGVRLFLGLQSFAKPCSSTACGELALVLEFVAIGPHQSAELTVQVGDVRGGIGVSWPLSQRWSAETRIRRRRPIRTVRAIADAMRARGHKLSHEGVAGVLRTARMAEDEAYPCAGATRH